MNGHARTLYCTRKNSEYHGSKSTTITVAVILHPPLLLHYFHFRISKRDASRFEISPRRPLSTPIRPLHAVKGDHTNDCVNGRAWLVLVLIGNGRRTRRSGL